ncbi:MAG: HD domain-containing protein [Candidatus Rokuibacteriota bacterium]
MSAPTIAVLRAVVRAAGSRSSPVLVGGSVRDGLLRRASVDVDVAVERGALALAGRAGALLEGVVVVLDAERGAARVIAGDHRIDVTDFRGLTLATDLARRDYTVNALAVSLRELLRVGRAPVIDPTGGLGDLRARRLCLTGKAALVDDPLRGLRGVRLEATLGFSLTGATRRAIHAGAGDLAQVSAERVREEWLAIFETPSAARAVRRMDALGLLAVVMPEVEPMRVTPQPAPHRFAVLEHSLRALAGADRLLERLGALGPFGDDLAEHMRERLAGGVDRRQTLKLAALLHDVAKPETRQVVRGRVRFFEHDVIGAGRVRGIGERLRLPSRVSEVLERLVRHHLRPMHLAQVGRVTPRARYRFFRDLGDEACDLLLLALIDGAAVTGASPLSVWRRAAVVRHLLAGRPEALAAAAATPLLRGEDVMGYFGIGPGPAVGRLLARAREAQALEKVGTREEALAFLDSSGRRL